jgi:hypothetical protein
VLAQFKNATSKEPFTKAVDTLILETISRGFRMSIQSDVS